MISKKRILSRVDSVPTPSVSVSRLYALLHDERAGASDFERMIKPDPALTANLLRMANSPFFGLSRKVTSIQHAITLMGTKRLFEAATSASFLRLLPPKLLGYEIEAKAFWLHSIAVAILSEKLAVKLGLRASDLTFTAGLLHDIGKLVIGFALAEESEEIRSRINKGNMSLVSAEQEVLGTNHAEIGAAVGDKWTLPEPLVIAAQWHHTPSDLPEEADRSIAELVHVADSLAHSLGFGADVGELHREVDPRVLQRIGVKNKQLMQLASEVTEQIKEMGALFLNPQPATSSTSGEKK